MNWKKMEKCDKQKTDGLTDNVSRHAPLKMLLILELSYYTVLKSHYIASLIHADIYI